MGDVELLVALFCDSLLYYSPNPYLVKKGLETAIWGAVMWPQLFSRSKEKTESTPSYCFIVVYCWEAPLPAAAYFRGDFNTTIKHQYTRSSACLVSTLREAREYFSDYIAGLRRVSVENAYILKLDVTLEEAKQVIEDETESLHTHMVTAIHPHKARLYLAHPERTEGFEKNPDYQPPAIERPSTPKDTQSCYIF